MSGAVIVNHEQKQVMCFGSVKAARLWFQARNIPEDEFFVIPQLKRDEALPLGELEAVQPRLSALSFSI